MVLIITRSPRSIHLTINGTIIAEWFKNLARIIEKTAKKMIVPRKVWVGACNFILQGQSLEVLKSPLLMPDRDI